jgi:Protein of unknown function (DUF3102)
MPEHDARAADLVAQIERAHCEAIRAASSAVDRAIACGELLIRKAEVRQHGRWLDWVEANLSFGERQAQKYMRLAAHKAELANTNSPSSLFTINGALAAIRAPPQDDDPPAAEPPQAPDDGRLFGDLARAMNAPTWGKAAREQRRRAAGASASALMHSEDSDTAAGSRHPHVG